MRAEEEVEDVPISAFLEAPTCRIGRRSLGRLSSESSALRLSDSQAADSFDSSSKGSSDDSDLGHDKGEEEKEEDDDEEEMEFLAPNYHQEDFGDETDAYVPRSP